MPQDFTGLLRQSSVSDANDTLARPKLDAHVFCRVLEDQGNVEVDDNGYAMSLGCSFWNGKSCEGGGVCMCEHWFMDIWLHAWAERQLDRC